MGLPQIDVAVITMKEEEYVAALDAFDPNPALLRSGTHRDYDVSRVETPRGPCHVAITRCVQQGNAHAQNAATDVIDDLSPAFVLVLGIAGGVPTTDFTLGDVILSSYIHDLTLEDTGTGTSRFNVLGGPLHSDAARIVERLQAILRSVDKPSIGRHRPEFDGKHTTDASEWNAAIDEAFEYHRKSGRDAPILRAERVASSDRLVKDPDLIAAWRHVIKGIACAEMESAGVYVVCQRKGIPALAIRGISDIIGWKRDDAWTLYACETAARFASALVSSGALCRSGGQNRQAEQTKGSSAAGSGRPRANKLDEARSTQQLAEENQKLFFSGRSTAPAPGFTFPMATEAEQIEAVRDYIDRCLRRIKERRDERSVLQFAASGPRGPIFRDQQSHHSLRGFSVHLEAQDASPCVITVWYGNGIVPGAFGFACGDAPIRNGIRVDFTEACIDAGAELISREFERKHAPASSRPRADLQLQRKAEALPEPPAGSSPLSGQRPLPQVATLKSSTGAPVQALIWQLQVLPFAELSHTKSEVHDALTGSVVTYDLANFGRTARWPRTLVAPNAASAASSEDQVWHFPYSGAVANEVGAEHLAVRYDDGSVIFQRDSLHDSPERSLDFGTLAFDAICFMTFAGRFARKLGVGEHLGLACRVWTPPSVASVHALFFANDVYPEQPDRIGRLSKGFVSGTIRMQALALHDAEQFASLCKRFVDLIANEFVLDAPTFGRGAAPFLAVSLPSVAKLIEKLAIHPESSPQLSTSPSTGLTPLRPDIQRLVDLELAKRGTRRDK